MKKKKLPSHIRYCAGLGSCRLVADKHDPEEDEENRIRKFTMDIYNGGRMNVGFFDDVVIDLAGMTVSEKNRPILKDHNTLTPVGHTVGANGKGNGVIIGETNLVLEGVFSVKSEASRLIIESSDNGFPWQSSVGIDVERLVFFEEGESGEANGQTFDGPVLIARKSIFKEGSFVPLGADDSTTTKVAANVAETKEMEFFMKKFEKWLAARGIDIKKIDDAQLKLLQADFDAEEKLQAASNTPTPEPKPEPVPVQAAAVPAAQPPLDIEKFKKEMQATMLEQNEINNLCAGNPKLHKLAIDNNWNAETVKKEKELIELREFRAGNVENFNFGVGSDSNGAPVAAEMEISILRAGGYSEDKILKEYGEKTVEASDKRFGSRLGLQESVVISARANGYNGPSSSFNNDRNAMFASAFSMQAATSFGTMDLSGILSNVANKFFVDGFNDVESVWRMVSAVRNVRDFKEISSYSLTGDMNYELVGPGGEIKSGDVGEVKYTNQADTYAKMFGINRTNLINDDLGALTRVPFKLGRGGAIKLNLVFWTEFLDNLAFFTVAQGNKTTGAPLSITELTAMLTAFRLLKDPNDNPMATRPDILLTGVENEVLASQLNNDTIIVDGTATALQPNGNPHKGKFTPVTSVYLSDTTIGGSATASYLLANPNSMPVIEVAFLNGVETPTVETAQARFDTLGIDMRGFHDFGVNKQEFRGGVKSDGV